MSGNLHTIYRVPTRRAVSSQGHQLGLTLAQVATVTVDHQADLPNSTMQEEDVCRVTMLHSLTLLVCTIVLLCKNKIIAYPCSVRI